MDWKHLAPYLAPVLVVALMARRVMRAQQAKPVRLWRLWIIPAILVVGTGAALANEPQPSLLVAGAFLVAAAAGGAFGWFRVHTLEFAVDPESGVVTSKATQLSALVLVGLLLVRYALKYFLNDEGVKGAALIHWTDGLLVFMAAMMVAQSAHTFVQARRLKPPAIATLPGT
jgi:membrane protein CcdC involved in cytochrome C biogenesis